MVNGMLQVFLILLNLQAVRHPLVLLQKFFGYPFDPFACEVRKFHATLKVSVIYHWKNLIKRREKMKACLKFDLHYLVCIPKKPYQTIPLSGLSKLVVGRYQNLS
jgi:hypothetical protein